MPYQVFLEISLISSCYSKLEIELLLNSTRSHVRERGLLLEEL